MMGTRSLEMDARLNAFQNVETALSRLVRSVMTETKRVTTAARLNANLRRVFTTARIHQVVKRNAATVTLLKPDATCQVCPLTPERAMHIASIVFSICLALFYCVDLTVMLCVVRLAVLSARTV